MKIALHDIGKRFSRQWLYKGINHEFAPKSATAVIGNNGSGKSTLLQIIYGYQVPSRGKLEHTFNGNLIRPEQLPRHTSFVAPYLDLPEELTLSEMLDFHFGFKTLKPGFSKQDLVKLAHLSGNEHKYLRYFSSGMKQRVKLILALFSEHDLLLLDEPCTNLDEQGISWYRSLVNEYKGQSTIIIASNQTFEHDFCEAELRLAVH